MTEEEYADRDGVEAGAEAETEPDDSVHWEDPDDEAESDDSAAGTADGSANGAAPEARGEGSGPSSGGIKKLLAAGGAGIVVFGAVTGVATWRWLDLRDSGAGDTQIGSAEPVGEGQDGQNQQITLPDAGEAFLDQTRTAQALEAARGIVEGVFSYSYQDLDAYQDALNTYLDADMLARYQETADENVAMITQAQTTVQATVKQGDAGVQSLDGDDAVAVLIMSREGNNADGQKIADAAPLRVTMVNVDGAWLADDITLL